MTDKIIITIFITDFSNPIDDEGVDLNNANEDSESIM